MRVERVRVLQVNHLVRAERLRRHPRRGHLIRLHVLRAVGHDADPRRRDEPQFAGRAEPRLADALRCHIPEAISRQLEVDDGEVPQLPRREPRVRAVEQPAQRVRVRQRRLFVFRLPGVHVQERLVPRGLLRDRVDGRVHPRAVVAELLGGVVVPPPGGRVRRREHGRDLRRRHLRRRRAQCLEQTGEQGHKASFGVLANPERQRRGDRWHGVRPKGGATVHPVAHAPGSPGASPAGGGCGPQIGTASAVLR